MLSKIILFILSSVFFVSGGIAQNTIGLLTYNDSKAYDGYNLLYPHNQPNVYLIDNCGEIVHSWDGESDQRPANTAYISKSGKLVITSRPAVFTGDVIWAGGGGENILIKDWDNNIEWSYELNNPTGRLHHDIAIVEKEGGAFNILAIAWELKTREEAIEAGRDSSLISSDVLWPDYIFEIDPSNDEIVWEWHAWDHLIQDFDSTKSNFGVVADHPEKININQDFSASGAPDWLHANSIDYDPFNDLVMLSVPYFSEIWIIDHTTNTSQAASSNGGFGGKGGDLLYRWGNPQMYGAGTEEDQQLFFSHDANFIDDFIDPFDPLFGSVSLFNNRITDSASSISIFDTGFDMYEFGFPFDNGVFGPVELDLNLFHPIDSSLMYSTGLSSMQVLPNGNYLICVGRWGYNFEMTPDQEIVWEYRTPFRGGAPLTQGDSTEINDNLTFRIKRFPSDYEAFEGRDLSSKGWIENEPNVDYCALLFTSEFKEMYGLEIFPNPAQDMITIKWEAGKFIDIDVYSMNGQRMEQIKKVSGGRKYIDTSYLPSGVYLLQINGEQAGKFLIQN